MSTEGGTRAIVAALLANLGIAVTKFVAFLLSGSSSMLAEAIHSLADSGNQALLLLGGRSAPQGRPQHPFGYGRERYIYAFIVSIVLFTVGGLFAIYEGYEKIQHPHDDRGLAAGCRSGVLRRRDHRRVASPSARRSRSPTTCAASSRWVEVRPPRQGARAAGRPAGGLRRAGRPGLRAVRRRA